MRKEDPEAHHMKIPLSVATVTGLVLVEEVMIGILDMVMMREEVPDTSKKVGSMVIIEVVLLVLRLSMIGAEMIGLEMAGSLKIVEYLMEIQNWKAGHLNEQKVWIRLVPLWLVQLGKF